MVARADGTTEPLRNAWFESSITGTNCWYAVDSSGNMLTGLVRHNGFVYYLQVGGSEAGKLLANTTVDIGGIIITLDSEGKVVGDLSILQGAASIYDMDSIATADQNVAALSFTAGIGWVDAGNGIMYYMVPKLDAAGNVTYVKAIGIMEINGLYYCFDTNGVMLVGLHEVNGTLYYFEETGLARGSVHVGYVTVNGVTYYCDPNKGGAATVV